MARDGDDVIERSAGRIRKHVFREQATTGVVDRQESARLGVVRSIDDLAADTLDATQQGVDRGGRVTTAAPGLANGLIDDGMIGNTLPSGPMTLTESLTPSDSIQRVAGPTAR